MKTEWISVKDQLPDDADLVLVYSERSGVRTDYYYNDEWEYYDRNQIEITHWMPLPEPPTQ